MYVMGSVHRQHRRALDSVLTISQGLAFSVKRGVAIPPSLRNMYKEMTTEVPGFVAPKHG